jgi:hypothetical protein
MFVSFALLLAPLPSSANGRFPAANAILFSTHDRQQVILRTTFGLLLSRDAGTTWDWLCEDAFGLAASSIEDPSIGMTDAGVLVVGTTQGLEVSSDGGCNFRAVGGPLANLAIRDIVVRRDTPRAVLALASTLRPDAGAGGGPGYLTQIFESPDDGADWSPVGPPLDPTAVPTTIEVASGDPQRLYVSIFRGQGAARSAALLVSVDHGAQWIERPVPLDAAAEAGAYIAAVAPNSPDRVYIRTDGRSRLLVTEDAGRSFATALAFTGPMLGFALSADGLKAFAGGPEDGLNAQQGASFHRVSKAIVQCLAMQGTDLWACAEDPSSSGSGFAAGVSSDEGATFSPRLRFADVRGPILCAAGATASSSCTMAAFRQLCPSIGCSSEEATGMASAMATYDAAALYHRDASVLEIPVRIATSSCGCRAAGSGRDDVAAAGGAPWETVAAAAVVLGVVFVVRRRRPRPRRCRHCGGIMTGTRASLLS